MGYYLRVLGITDPNISLHDIHLELVNEGINIKFEVDPNESLELWTVVDVFDESGDLLCQIERNPTIVEGLGQDEIVEFTENVQLFKPKSAAKWLIKFFTRVAVIYAIRLFDAGMDDDNLSIVNSIKGKIWNKVGGILQADGEGFSNENGYHILWQFSNNVNGEWHMSVKNFFGNWINFVMDMGDLTQREEFLSGSVPKSARKL